MGFDSTYLDYVAIGNKIRELRHIHNLSQTELADQLGITAAGFSLIERGLSKLTLERAVQISRIFHISIDQLLFDENTASIQRVYFINQPVFVLHAIQGSENSGRRYTSSL